MDEQQTAAEAPKPVAKKAVRRTRKRQARKAAPKVRQAAEETMETVEEEPKKHNVTTPWKPVSILKAPSIPGFVTRWTDKTRIGLIDKRLDEGWSFVIDKTGSQIRQHLQRTIKDGTDIDGTVQRRELVLMKLPMERKQARDKYIADKTMTPEKMAVQLERDMAQASGESGHSIFKVATEGG